MASYRQYALTITSSGAGGTNVRVQEWDIPASSYPRRVASVHLKGVEFPAHRDALEALQVAIDMLIREGLG